MMLRVRKKLGMATGIPPGHERLRRRGGDVERTTNVSTSTYTVKGMTCGHCINSVTSELSSVAGVSDVRVDLHTGRVVVTGDGPIDDAAVCAAVDEAGYEVVR